MTATHETLTPPIEARDRVVVVGKTGTGKSFYVKSVLLHAHPRVVVWDPKGEYRAGRHDAPPGMRPLEQVDIDGFADIVAGAAGEQGELAVSVSGWAGCYTRQDRAEAFADFVGIIEDCRDLLLVVEECAILPPQAGQYLEYVACLSRDWEMPLVMVSQRAVQIEKSARDQATRVVSFRQERLDDAAALGEILGDSNAAKIPQLPPRQYVYWHESHTYAPAPVSRGARAHPTSEPTGAGAPSTPSTRTARRKTGKRKAPRKVS